VQLVIQHKHLRRPNNLKPFHDTILHSFDEEHNWRYKSISRKLLDLEGYWRIKLIRRGSRTGTKSDGDLSQAMESWIKFIDEEKALVATHAAADEQDRVERQVSAQ